MILQREVILAKAAVQRAGWKLTQVDDIYDIETPNGCVSAFGSDDFVALVAEMVGE